MKMTEEQKTTARKQMQMGSRFKELEPEQQEHALASQHHYNEYLRCSDAGNSVEARRHWSEMDYHKSFYRPSTLT